MSLLGRITARTCPGVAALAESTWALPETVSTNHPLAMQHVLALGDRDIARQCNGLLLQIVNAEIAARRLILGNDSDAAARLDPANVLRTRRHCTGLLLLRLLCLLLLRLWLLRLLLLPLSLGCTGRGTRLGPVEHDRPSLR